MIMQARKRFSGLSMLLGLMLTIAVVTTQNPAPQDDAITDAQGADFLVLNPELD